MKQISLDKKWTFRRGLLDSVGMMAADPGIVVDLPHDGMIGLDVSRDAQALYESGYYPGDVCNYTKYVYIPKEWETGVVGLQFDGAMMHAAVEINGCKVAEHHYGYSPFYVDLTDYVTFGEENRITVNLNTGVQPSSRWYTGSGLYRGVTLLHAPEVHIIPDGVYLFTKEVTEEFALLEAQVDVENSTRENKLALVTLTLFREGENKEDNATVVRRTIQINPGKSETARLAVHLKNPVLWDADEPNLYHVKATVKELGSYRTHFMESSHPTVDEADTVFGVRTITADAVRGLRINGKATKLKGGCIHHDNGLLGAVSLYECEARKVRKLKEIGFNAIRTAHNPPSRYLVEACDRLGMYIFDEAFDAWGIAKRTGDYSQYFETQWEKDLTSFVRRDRIHPSVILWSTGNEIPERGGLNNGYTLAKKLADTIRTLDASRPISNGICSMWSGLDDALATGQNQAQNAENKRAEDFWEKQTEAFTNGLDIVGYNYMEELYTRDHELYPERVILGSENFPKEIGYRWRMVEELSYVIGDFTWTAWDYLGEAGIGKSVFAEKDDPIIGQGSWALMPPATSPYPWRLANDADVDITGRVRPQGDYRSVVFGSERTFVYSVHPKHFGKTEVISMWGFPDVQKCWNYDTFEGCPIEVVVFSGAEEVELIVNGQLLQRKKVDKDGILPYSVRFETTYQRGTLEAVSYCFGKEISRDRLVTSKPASKLRLLPEKTKLFPDGHDLVFIGIDILDEENQLVTDASVKLTATVEGAGSLAGFGTGNPKTEENYTDGETVTYHGHATAVLRSAYETGTIRLCVKAEGMKPEQVQIDVDERTIEV